MMLNQPVAAVLSTHHILIHLSLDKMAANLADDIFKCASVNEKFYILIEICFKFVPKGPIDNNLALV